tara:strand:+ start:1352 stop:1534 length:183 start_codon:yes stop_codon:yes gene_type:complete
MKSKQAGDIGNLFLLHDESKVTYFDFCKTKESTIKLLICSNTDIFLFIDNFFFFIFLMIL